MNIDEKLTNRIVAAVTSGKCKRYNDCYRPFENVKRLIGNRNLVLGISSNSKIDFTNLDNQIVSNNWYFIYDGEFLKLWTGNTPKVYLIF